MEVTQALKRPRSRSCPRSRGRSSQSPFRNYAKAKLTIAFKLKFCIVQKVLNCKTSSKGHEIYVKWKGLGESENCWVKPNYREWKKPILEYLQQPNKVMYAVQDPVYQICFYLKLESYELLRVPLKEALTDYPQLVLDFYDKQVLRKYRQHDKLFTDSRDSYTQPRQVCVVQDNNQIRLISIRKRFIYDDSNFLAVKCQKMDVHDTFNDDSSVSNITRSGSLNDYLPNKLIRGIMQILARIFRIHPSNALLPNFESLNNSSEY